MAYLSTSASLIQRAYRFLRDASAAPQVWASAQVVDYLDEAHAIVCADLNLLESRWYVGTVAGTGSYVTSAEMTTIRHVLLKDDAVSTTKYRRIERGTLTDILLWQQDPDASGTVNFWTLGGVNFATNIILYPAPNASAASGLMAIGNASPQSISQSASPLPRTVLPLVPVYAALLAWEDLGSKVEAQQLSAMYHSRLMRWKPITNEMSPEGTDSHLWGTEDTDIAFGTRGQFTRRWNPINPW